MSASRFDPLSGARALLAAYEGVVEVSWAVLDDIEQGEYGPEAAVTAYRLLAVAHEHVRPHLSARENERAESLLGRLRALK